MTVFLDDHLDEFFARPRPVRPVTPPAPGWLWAAGELAMTAAELAEWNIARIGRRGA